MPEQHEVFTMRRHISRVQMHFLRQGNIPQEMEDKWFWYMEGNTLYTHAYGIEWVKSASYVCTVQMGRRLLPKMSHCLDAMCDYYDIALDHHRADSDSHACAEILLRYLKSGAEVKQFIRSYKFE